MEFICEELGSLRIGISFHNESMVEKITKKVRHFDSCAKDLGIYRCQISFLEEKYVGLCTRSRQNVGVLEPIVNSIPWSQKIELEERQFAI